MGRGLEGNQGNGPRNSGKLKEGFSRYRGKCREQHKTAAEKDVERETNSRGRIKTLFRVASELGRQT